MGELGGISPTAAGERPETSSQISPTASAHVELQKRDEAPPINTSSGHRKSQRPDLTVDSNNSKRLINTRENGSLESPPYSPGTDPSITHRIPSSEPTPARTAVDANEATGAFRDTVLADSSQETPPKAPASPVTEDGRRNRLGDIVSSPLSVNGLGSTRTSGVDAHTPATSPENESTHPKTQLSLPVSPQGPTQDSTDSIKLSSLKSMVLPRGSQGVSTTVSPRSGQKLTPMDKADVFTTEVPVRTEYELEDNQDQQVTTAKAAGTTPERQSSVTTQPSLTVAKDHTVDQDTDMTEASGAPARHTFEEQDLKQHSKLRRGTLLRATSVNRITKAKRLRQRKLRHSNVIIGPRHKQGYTRIVQALKADHAFRTPIQKRDYMTTMFLRQALDSTHGGPDLPKLLTDSSKTGTTSDWLKSMREEQDCRIIKRIYKLQEGGRWSPRQMKPGPEPAAQVTHWDYLLKEMKWLQTDFREERKFKLALAKQLADWCVEWHCSTLEERLDLQVRLKSNGRSGVFSLADGPMYDETEAMAIFDDCVDPSLLCINKSVLPEKLLQSLPLYDSLSSLPVTFPTASQPDISLDELESMPIEDDPAKEKAPEEDACALFDPGAKIMKARLNASNAYKPPSVPLPSAAFYEFRYASQWTYDEDQQLRNLVKEFTGNWLLISELMSSKAQFVPVSDRRTPWECYERLMGMEGPPADTNLRQYYRHFQYRIEQAKVRWQAEQAKQQALQNPTVISIPPLQVRRFPSPVRVDKKVNKRFMAMLGGARTLARKRESIANKQPPPQQDGMLLKSCVVSTSLTAKLKFRGRNCQERSLQKRQHLRIGVVESTKLRARSKTKRICCASVNV